MTAHFSNRFLNQSGLKKFRNYCGLPRAVCFLPMSSCVYVVCYNKLGFQKWLWKSQNWLFKMLIFISLSAARKRSGPHSSGKRRKRFCSLLYCTVLFFVSIVGEKWVCRDNRLNFHRPYVYRYSGKKYTGILDTRFAADNAASW